MSLFEAKQIHKRFGQQVVLENIEMSFEANQLSGIMGPNGAGKTTLLLWTSDAPFLLRNSYRTSRGRTAR
jgi:ABC-type multidrug transport system ATPase subunit